MAKNLIIFDIDNRSVCKLTYFRCYAGTGEDFEDIDCIKQDLKNRWKSVPHIVPRFRRPTNMKIGHRLLDTQ